MRAFDLKQPANLDEALAELPKERTPDGPQVLAGGQDLLSVMKDDIEQPRALVDIKRLPDMDGIEWRADGSLVLGALVRIQDLADEAGIQERMPAISEAAASVASPQIRAQATLGGNLNQRPRCPYYRHPAVSCYKKGGSSCLAEFGFSKYACIFGGGPSYFSHPSDMAPPLIALGAEAELVGPLGSRTVALSEYFVGPEEALDTETVRRPDEVMTKIVVPAPAAGTRSTYLKFKERASYDFALSAAAIVLRLDGSKIADARVVLGGVAPKPWPSPEAEAELVGKEMAPATWKAAGAAAVADAEPLENNGYKVHLVKGVLHRALESLA